MPIPSPNLYPEFNTIRLSHVVYGVKDTTASRKFYTEMIGLQVSDEDSSHIYLRGMEERGHHSIVLKESKEAEVDVLGFKTFSDQDLDRAEQFFKSKNCPTKWTEHPYQGRTLVTTDVHGIPIEFYHKMDQLPPIHQNYSLYRGVKPLRIDHFNSFSPNVDESVEFWNELGFRVTEYTEDEESGRLWAAWMHRKGNIHDMAFTNGKGPKLHHTAFWVPTPLNIIDLLDLMSTSGYLANIERGPGRHGISNAFFLYVLDPDGHRIEIYCSDYLTVDPDMEPIKWDLKDPQRQTLWGSPAPQSWFENGSMYKNLSPRDADLKATPIVAP